MDRVDCRKVTGSDSLKLCYHIMDRSMLTYDGPEGITFGVVVHANPECPSFEHAIHVVQTALKASCKVFLYLLDDAVTGVDESGVRALVQRGVKVSACGFAVEKRDLACPDDICPAGLTTLSDILFYAEVVSVYN